MRPSNDEELLRELDRRCQGRGNGERTAKEIGVWSSHLRSMRSGDRHVNLKVAAALGFELRWVKVEKER